MPGKTWSKWCEKRGRILRSVSDMGHGKTGDMGVPGATWNPGEMVPVT